MFLLNFGGLLKLWSPRFPFDIENPTRENNKIRSIAYIVRKNTVIDENIEPGGREYISMKKMKH